MNEKERLLNILRGVPVDRPAVICPGGMMNMVICEVMEEIGVFWPEAHVDAEQLAALAAAMHDLGGLENAGVPFCMTIEAEAMGAGVFLGTRETEPRVVEYPMQEIADWRKLTNIAESNNTRLHEVLKAIKILKKKTPDAPVIGNLTGPVSLATSLIEATVFYKGLRRQREEALAFLEFVTDNLIWFGKAMIQAGADCIVVADPSGTGEILGPKLFREIAIPYLNRLCDSLQATGTDTIIHICGRLKDVLPELDLLKSKAISVDSITNLKLVRESVHGKAVMGNISTFLLEKGEAAKIKIACEAALKNGSDIIAPACGIGARTPLNNFRAMTSAVKGVI